MEGHGDLSLLISNIIDGKHYSHCRLCLKWLKGTSYTKFDDNLIVDESAGYLILKEAITKIFSKEACEEIPGINAVCDDCVIKILHTLTFIELYEKSTSKLHKVVDNMNVNISFDVNEIDEYETLYLECDEEQTQLMFVANPMQECGTMIHQCDSCTECFYSLNDLEEHNEQHHGTYLCKKCGYKSTNMDELMKHGLTIDTFKCISCPQYRCTEKSLREHIDSEHGTQHICKICGKTCRGLDKLIAHENKHQTNYQCPKCGKTYLTKEFYTKHVPLCLKGEIDPHPYRNKYEKSFYCKECGKGYSTKSGLRVHNKFVHENATPHTCNECGKEFTAACYLKVHMVTHTKEKNFPCTMCPKKFVSKEALLYHVRRHTGEKPYSCDICGKTFVNASTRAEHVKYKHVGPTLSCDLCSKKFVTKTLLRKHLKKHNDPTNKLNIEKSNMPVAVPKHFVYIV